MITANDIPSYLSLTLPLLLVITLVGCAGSRTSFSGPAPSTLTEINRALDGQPGIIHLTSGQTVRGYDVDVHPDSTRWTTYDEEGAESDVTVETEAVRRIERPAPRSPFFGRVAGALGVAAGCAVWEGASTCRVPQLIAVLFAAELAGQLLVRRIVPEKRRVIYRAPVTQYLSQDVR